MLTSKQQKFFEENGYLVINGKDFFDYNIIPELTQLCKKKFVNYENHKLINDIPIDKAFNHKGVSYFKNSNLNFKNKLFGFRATINNWNFNNGLSKYIENKNLLCAVKQILKTNHISLHTSALIKVYPGCEGEPKKLHVDTPGFVEDTIGFVSKNKFVLNTLIYLNDVDNKLAPLRVCPKSHKYFVKINNYMIFAC